VHAFESYLESILEEVPMISVGQRTSTMLSVATPGAEGLMQSKT
jgi:hypothetical protein